MATRRGGRRRRRGKGARTVEDWNLGQPILDLSGKGLLVVPESVSKLVELKELYLQNNKLEQVPDWIGNLIHLEVLDLSDNHIGWLPESLCQLTSLSELYLHGNELLGLPLEIMGPTRAQVLETSADAARPTAIIRYYVESLRSARPLNEAKLIFVGRGGVGKTSLVNRLVRGTFFENQEKTEGINITHYKVRLKAGGIARLNIWDFGGQEIMHATHQFFLTERSLYLLVLNGREGLEEADVEYWLKLIESFGGESPVIIVLNKIKEHPFAINYRSLYRKYPRIKRLIRTDCRDNYGIRSLRKAIKNGTGRLTHLRDPFPADWLKIKEELEEMKANYLSFDQYREFCNEFGEEDKDAQDDLARYLHCLGIALNYRDDARLRDTHVLNPHWVTRGIYAILNSPITHFQKGQVNLEQLTDILDPDEYPPSMRRFLLDLMKKFELCFSFPGDETQFLIPELLEKQEPREAAQFSPSDCLNFEYHYEVLPEGLVPRFIVRTHSLSEDLPKWRTGTILKFERNEALVKADLQERKVFIRVMGDSNSRRRLLAVIRSDFDRIHADIKKLQPTPMVPLPRYPPVAIPYEELILLERNGIQSFPKVVAGHVEQLSVSDLLDGVDFGENDNSRQSDDTLSKRIRVFYSYSHRDERLRNLLDTHLKILQRQGMISTWHDRMIEAGDDWKRSIDSNLERADIILLLVSSDFIASDYCWEKEMRRAIERHNTGTARVVPIILRPLNWDGTPFAHIQALPTDARPVTTWKNRDSAWTNISTGIEQIVQDLKRRSPNSLH